MNNHEMVRKAIKMLLKDIESITDSYLDVAGDEEFVQDPVLVIAMALNEIDAVIQEEAVKMLNGVTNMDYSQPLPEFEDDIESLMNGPGVIRFPKKNKDIN